MNNEDNKRGVWIPEHIMDRQAAGGIGASEVMLLAIIDSLSAHGKTCFASNIYLAGRLGVGERRVRQMLLALREAGLLRVTGFDGRKRTLKTTWKREGGVEFSNAAYCKEPADDRQFIAGLTGNKLPPSSEDREESLQSGLVKPDGAGIKIGFGMVAPQKENTTQFDLEIATKLLEAVRHHLGTSHPIARKARVTEWAKHIQRLRTVDDTAEGRVESVVAWYIEHMGQDFVPEAYAGESFRRKFDAIERQMRRDVAACVTVGPEAAAVAARLACLNWPGGLAESVPAAAQACMDEYTRWVARRDALVVELRQGVLDGNAARGRARLLAFGEHLVRVMPGAAHFVRMWLESVNKRICGINGWCGELTPFLFKPNAEKFHRMGRRWAEEYAHDPERWDAFCKEMEI